MFGYIGSVLARRQAIKEGYKTKGAINKNVLSWPARGAFMLFDIILTIAAFLVAIDIFQVKKLEPWILFLIFLLFFVPVVGDILAIVLISYWILSIRPQSKMLDNMGLSNLKGQ
jgi:hypothetical protein